jgi:GTPase SAR1 family protein
MSNSVEEKFMQAYQKWDLERLYTDLGKIKSQELTPTEKQDLRALLLRYSPSEIAEKTAVNPDTVRSRLSKGLYRHIEALLEKPEHTVKSNEVSDLLEKKGYKFQQIETDTFSRTSFKKIDRLNKPDCVSWGIAPDLPTFYGRTQELQQLEEWILRDRCRLVTVLGIGGVGKTTLSIKLVRQIYDRFDLIIWRSLRHAPPIHKLLEDWLQFLSGGDCIELDSVEQGLLKLLEHLKSYRCLLVLDDTQMILKGGALSGSYRKDYEQYGSLFQQIAESNHQSCLLLTSWEKFREIAPLEGLSSPVRSLTLNGLGAEAKQILKEKGLGEEELWEELINPYQGNPLAIKIVANAIQDVFNGNVSEFLKQNTLFLGDFEYLLYQQFERLSDLEKSIMLLIAKVGKPIFFEEVKSGLSNEISSSKLLQVLESLVRRSLLEKSKETNFTLFSMQPVVTRYTINYC